MSIFHYLFWIKDKEIMAVRWNGEWRKLKIGGKALVPFTEDYWEQWMEYAGYCEGDQTDFCLVYDDEIEVKCSLLDAQCPSGKRIWSREKIKSAIETIVIREPIEFRTEEDRLLFKTGTAHQKKMKEMKKMGVWYAALLDETVEEAVLEDSGKKSEFVTHYEEKYRKYKENR